MNESRRMEMINQFMDSFSENIVGFNNTVFDAMQSLEAELANVQSNAQVPYSEPANFNKFTKKYKQEFFEEQYRKQAERNQEVEASTNSINNRMDAVRRSASLGVNEIIAESSRDLESMRTFRNRMQAELDDLQSQLSAKKQQFSEIVHNDALSLEERHAQIEALKEPGLNARIEELTSRIASIDAFTNEVEKLSSLDVEDTEKIQDTLFEVAQNLGEQVNTRAQSKGVAEEVQEVAEEVAQEQAQEVAPEQQQEEVVENVTKPDEQTAPEVVEQMDEEQIRRRMAELMGLSYDEFVNREIKYEVANPGKNFINDIYPHDIEYQMDDWAVDEFNDLRDKLHQIKGMNVETQGQTSNRIDEIRKRMGELLGIPPFEGIENENEHAIQYQMDDWAIDEFQELRDELKQLLNEQKANEAEAPIPPVTGEPEETQGNEQTQTAPAAAPAEPEAPEAPALPGEVPENLVDREFSTEAPGLNFNAKKTANDNAKKIIGKRKAGIAIVLGGATVAAIAATSLFGVPVATAVLAGSAVLGTAEVLDTLTRVAREKAVTRNLRKFADAMGLEVVFDYDAGTVNFAKAVKNGDKYEYIPVKDKKTMYEIAASRGMSKDETDALFKKCTRKPVTNPLAAAARGIKDLFAVNKEGKDLDIIALTGTNEFQHGLADLYSDFGGIRITDPKVEQDEIDKVVQEAKAQGMPKIDQNIAKLQHIRDNSTKYNLTEAQMALIDEAIEKQEAIKKNAGHRAMDFLKNMPITVAIKGIKDRLIAGRSEVPAIEEQEEQTQVNVETEEAPVVDAPVTAENAEEVVEAVEEAVEQQAEEVAEQQAEAPVAEAPVAPEANEAPAAPEAPSSTDNLDDIETNLNNEIDRLLEEDSLVSEVEEEERAEAQTEAQVATEQQAAEAVAEAVEAPVEVAPEATPVVNPEVVEQIQNAPDQTSVDMMVEQMRDANVPEENIEAALAQAGIVQQQEQGRSLGL